MSRPPRPLTLLIVGLCGCATATARHAPDAGNLDAGMAGWEALAAGRREQAERNFGARPDDFASLFGLATLAYERGETAGATAMYATLLARLALVGSSADGRLTAEEQALASVAAGRVATLYDELGTKDRDRLLAQLHLGTLTASSALPWLARLALVGLADRAASAQLGSSATESRSRLLEDRARDGLPAQSGCASRVFEVGALGRLPNLDLDDAGDGDGRWRAEDWRPLTESGCRLTIPATKDGLPAARLLRTSVDVGAAGEYTLVLDYPGEARVRIDGGPAAAHGDGQRYGPRADAYTVALAPGRHDLKVRLASKGGRADMRLMLFASASAGGRGAPSVRFVDPRVRTTAPAAAAPARAPAALAPFPERPFERYGGRFPRGEEALRLYCTAFAAGARESVDDSERALDGIRQLPRFAVGLALAGAVAADDPSRPTTFARDVARRALRAAVAVDPGLARAWERLGSVELEDDRGRDAIEAAHAAGRAAPSWWKADLLLHRALVARGLELDADRALAGAIRKAGASADVGEAACPLLEAMHHQAEERRQLEREATIGARLVACGGGLEGEVDRLRARGKQEAAIALLRAALRLDPGRDDLSTELASTLAAAGYKAEAAAELSSLVSRAPDDPMHRIRLGDALAAAGQLTSARDVVREALLAHPEVPEARQAARALGVPLPLDGFRVDGRAAIRAFAAGGPGRPAERSRDAGAIMVLDRSVMRVFPNGAVMTLTHQIVRVDSKDAIEKWGEIAVPSGAEILTLRTHKPDGTTREPEEIAGKETISAPELAIGDYVEWELLETHGPSEAFAPGFLGERFYFQSFDAPLARSEFLIVAPAAMTLAFDRRARPPAEEERALTDGTRVVSFIATDVPQLFAERAAVPAIEYVPSVRPSSGVSWAGWARYLGEELHEATRGSLDIANRAEQLRKARPSLTATGSAPAAALAETANDRRQLADQLVSWLTENIEPDDDLAEPATFTLARAHGSRMALALALARDLRIPARAVLARSRLTAETASPAPAQELDDFSEPLLELDVGSPGKPSPIFVDLRLRHAPLGYLAPGLDGARTLAIPDGRFGTAPNGTGRDFRAVDMTIHLDEKGSGVAVATEDLGGWPALEWAELVDRFGADQARLREDFEQRWLGVQFPGARLDDLQVDLPAPSSGRRGTARVRYSFVSKHLAVPVEQSGKGETEFRLAPTFFRSQPGRRFAAEPQRTTGLMLGFDVPVRLTARVELPGQTGVARVTGTRGVTVARPGGYRFVEERELRPGPAGRSSVLVLRRESVLPIMRVSPSEYPAVAADLRRVDGAEQEEIRIRLGAPGVEPGATR